MKMENVQLLKDYKSKLKDEMFKHLKEDMDKCVDCLEYHEMIAGILGSICDIDYILNSNKGGYAMPLFTEQTAEKWVKDMENSDGTTGEYWTIEQTTSVAKSVGIDFEHITEIDWWVAMNMMHSDYYSVATENGVDTPTFYAGLAKAFLFDKDAKPPKEKLHCYYEYIVKH